MDNKDGKKKESIDDILSDLNGLLNKMPSILDGIKMPDIKPVDFKESPAPAPAPVPEPEPLPEPAPAPAPEPEEKKAAEPVFDAERTVIMEPFSNLPEGAPLPVEGTAPAAIDKDIDKDDVAFAAPGPGDLAGFTFDEPSREPAADVPAAQALNEAAVPVNEPGNFPVVAHEDSPVMETPVNDGPAPAEKPADAEASALPEAGLAADTFGATGPAVTGMDPFINIPDAALQAPEAEAEAAPAASLTPAAEPGSPEQPAIKEDPVTDPSEDDLAEFERQLSSAVPQAAVQPQAEAQPAIEPQPVEAAAADIPMDPAIERPAAAMGEYQETEQAAVPEPAAELSLNADAVPADETLKFEPSTAAPQPGPGAQGIELEPAVNFADTLSAQEPVQAGGGLNAEVPQEPALSAGSESSGQGEATLVVAPQRNSGDDGEKTAVFQPSVGPGVTNRAKREDLERLASLPVPEGIPAERVRPLMFIYSPEGGALCANLLAELDAICQRSQTTPMFIKRTSVRPFDPDMNANFVLQTVTDSGAVGLVCVGEVPQEKLYEMENIFGSAGAYLRHYDLDSFSHTAMLDLLLEVILR